MLANSVRDVVCRYGFVSDPVVSVCLTFVGRIILDSHFCSLGAFVLANLVKAVVCRSELNNADVFSPEQKISFQLVFFFAFPAKVLCLKFLRVNCSIFEVSSIFEHLKD